MVSIPLRQAKNGSKEARMAAISPVSIPLRQAKNGRKVI